MQNHYSEQLKIYGSISNTAISASIGNRARALSLNESDFLSLVISRIRRKIEEILGEDLAKPYIISGESRQKRRILLDRSLIKVMD
ncbi:MAG: hypothetical protein PHY99_01030 [Bacteroidales bacterium]|nr:hypothetical protein [Bacteroidales bacterium]